jgi:hypothetical protein
MWGWARTGPPDRPFSGLATFAKKVNVITQAKVFYKSLLSFFFSLFHYKKVKGGVLLRVSWLREWRSGERPLRRKITR